MGTWSSILQRFTAKSRMVGIPWITNKLWGCARRAESFIFDKAEIVVVVVDLFRRMTVVLA